MPCYDNGDWGDGTVEERLDDATRAACTFGKMLLLDRGFKENNFEITKGIEVKIVDITHANEWFKQHCDKESENIGIRIFDNEYLDIFDLNGKNIRSTTLSNCKDKSEGDFPKFILELLEEGIKLERLMNWEAQHEVFTQ